MLKKKYRLKGDDIKKFFEGRFKTFKNEYFKIFYRDNSLKFSRFSVKPQDKIFKKAVERNRVRRRIYNILREEKIFEKIKGKDFLIFPQKKEILDIDYEELKEKISKILVLK